MGGGIIEELNIKKDETSLDIFENIIRGFLIWFNDACI